MGMLPKIVKPTTTVISPITNQEIKISPFTMADQKALLLVQRSTSEDDIIEAMVQIIRNCSNADPTKLDAIEFQWLMLQVRNMSSGSIVDTNLICENCEISASENLRSKSWEELCVYCNESMLIANLEMVQLQIKLIEMD